MPLTIAATPRRQACVEAHCEPLLLPLRHGEQAPIAIFLATPHMFPRERAMREVDFSADVDMR